MSAANMGFCGTCTVLAMQWPPDPARLAVQAGRLTIETVESLGRIDALHPVQQAFWEKHGLQLRLLYAGHADERGRTAARNPNPDGTPLWMRSAAICAAAPLTEHHRSSRARRRAAAYCCAEGGRVMNTIVKPPNSAHRQPRKTGPGSQVDRQRTEARRIRACSPAGPLYRDIDLPNMLTRRCCAARAPTPASSESISPPRQPLPGVVKVLTGAEHRQGHGAGYRASPTRRSSSASSPSAVSAMWARPVAVVVAKSRYVPKTHSISYVVDTRTCR